MTLKAQTAFSVFHCPSLNLEITLGQVVAIDKEYITMSKLEFNPSTATSHVTGKIYKVPRFVPHYFEF